MRIIALLSIGLGSFLQIHAQGENRSNPVQNTSNAVFLSVSDQAGPTSEVISPAIYGCDSSGTGISACPNVGTVDSGGSGGCISCIPCYQPVWQHCSGVYGGFLYLRPRDAEVSYAAPINGPIVGAPGNNPILVGELGITDPDYQPGFYVGVTHAISPQSSFDVRYTMFESGTNDHINVDAPDVIRSLVVHPSSQSAASDFLSADAQLEIDFDTLDADFRRLLCCGELHAVNYRLGGRWAQLDQRFVSEFQNNGTETVDTDIDFNGGGIRLGLDAERFSCSRQLSVYARGTASFVAGRFRGHYFQGSSVDPEVVDTHWEAGRIMPILDVELGVNWTSINGRLRCGAGYLVSAWFNTPKTEDFIRGVQNGNFVNLDDMVSFDGLNVHAEFRW